MMTWHNNTEQNDIKHNGTHHNDIQHNGTHHNDIQHNNIQHSAKGYIKLDTQLNDSGYRVFLVILC
jgi:hypothetical protein